MVDSGVNFDVSEREKEEGREVGREWESESERERARGTRERAREEREREKERKREREISPSFDDIEFDNLTFSQLSPDDDDQIQCSQRR